MQEHPFTETNSKILTTALLIFAVVSLAWGLLVIYGGLTDIQALADGVLFVGLLASAGYVSWFFISYIRAWQVQIALAVLIQLVCLGITFLILTVLHLTDPELFIYTLPLHLLIGLSGWIILIQWYHSLRVPETVTQMVTETRETIDKISVKDRSRIHIIALDDLYCIQASGDYVTFFTESDQYIKEQTMKYYELHLPEDSFVRIHRSSIVNVTCIMRVELFGKENYQVRLKNGITLRASNAGYKLLKERLSL